MKSNRMQTWRFQAWSLENKIVERFINESLHSGTELDICGPKVRSSSEIRSELIMVHQTLTVCQNNVLRSQPKVGTAAFTDQGRVIRLYHGRFLRSVTSPSNVDFKMISLRLSNIFPKYLQ